MSLKSLTSVILQRFPHSCDAVLISINVFCNDRMHFRCPVSTAPTCCPSTHSWRSSIALNSIVLTAFSTFLRRRARVWIKQRQCIFKVAIEFTFKHNDITVYSETFFVKFKSSNRCTERIGDSLLVTEILVLIFVNLMNIFKFFF